MEFENSIFELRDVTEFEFQSMDRAMIGKDELIGTQLKCGRKIRGEKFAKSTKDNPIGFKTPKLRKGKYPKKVK